MRPLLDCYETLVILMKKECDVCHKELEDEDDIVAAVVTVYHKVSSSVIYAMDKPTDCLRMIHLSCYEECRDDPTATE